MATSISAAGIRSLSFSFPFPSHGNGRPKLPNEVRMPPVQAAAKTMRSSTAKASSVNEGEGRSSPKVISNVNEGKDHRPKMDSINLHEGEERTSPKIMSNVNEVKDSQPKMDSSVNEGKGVFAPIVVLVRNIIGRKRFNQLRGKAIALHSQVITEFCKAIGADGKQRQALIRLAKKNGERLGFLA